jgi:signal transduction histidine kinase
MGGRDRLGMAAAGVALASIAADGVALAGGRPYAQGMALASKLGLAEAVVLLVLTVLVVRRSRPRVAVAAGALTGLAVPLWLLRFGPPTWSTATIGGYAAWGSLSAVAVVVGLYLRALDEGRSRAVVAARRAQRLELADDLHDFVVHDINEMLLQAQAGQVLVEGTAAGVGDVLRRIERTALRALTTVDRTVHLLRHVATPEATGTRGSDGTGAPRMPKPTVDDVPGLVDRFAATGPITVDLDLDPRLTPAAPTPPSLPSEIATTVYRIVVEALTNVRRHAIDAGHVRVGVACTPGESVRVEIVDDGRAGRRAHAGPGRGGHGLTGLAARVDALGGTLSTGPTEPAGWRVAAVLPLHPRPTATTAGR